MRNILARQSIDVNLSRNDKPSKINFSFWLLISFVAFVSSNFTLASASENCTETPISGELYQIINSSSGAALDVNGYSTEAGTNIISWEYKASSNQHFYLHQLDNGFWTIQSAHSRMNLDVFNFAQNDGANIIQWYPNNTENQQWRLRQSSNGAFNIVAKHSGKSITVAGSQNGANIYQNQYAASNSQRWFLNPVSIACNRLNKVSGFAGIAGDDGLDTTTGGANASPIIVDSCEQLKQTAANDSPKVIQIPDNKTIDCRTEPRTFKTCKIECPDYQEPGKSIFRIPVGGQTCRDLGANSEQLVDKPRNETRIKVGDNTTIIGLGKNSKVKGANFDLSNSKNIIVKNLLIEDVNPELVEAGDGITVNNASHILIEHVRFRLISDGHVDIKNSKNITLSWNRFDGRNSAVCGNQHHYTNLAHNAQVSFHHNFWDHTSGRNPKLTGEETRAHLFNNLWKNITYFAVSVSNGAQAKLEANYFENTSKPHWNEGTGFMDGGNIGNVYTGKSNNSSYRHTGDNWVLTDTPMYNYETDEAKSILHPLDKGTGPQDTE